MLFGIDVIVVAPGAVATPIWDKAETVDVERYANTPFAPALTKIRDYMIASGRKGLKPERLGRAVWRALTAKTPKTRYVVTPDRMQDFMVKRVAEAHGRSHDRGRLGLTRQK